VISKLKDIEPTKRVEFFVCGKKPNPDIRIIFQKMENIYLRSASKSI
tara:strand:+ start:39900 stop:40040 length:141 start_codon:yes stop_codon:yes gene_type:complete